ncbi:hypothetical protein [Agromyces sp. SYSU T00194]|uniref:hypothetical protein n=1 Tax=Agromyces chitinivorans TaxID=3158560 RepID=UPI00339115D9
MKDADDTARDHAARTDEAATGMTRRALARTAAWSVPVVALATAVPAYAASDGGGAPTRPVIVTADCGTGANGSFRIDAGVLAVGAQIRITLSHTGSGSFSATPQFTHAGTGNGPYIVTGTGADFDGVIDISFSLGNHGTGTVSIFVEGLDGLVLAGDTTSALTMRREGLSHVYRCTRV